VSLQWLTARRPDWNNWPGSVALRGRPLAIAGLVILWIASSLSGFWVLYAYKATPGTVGESPLSWPDGSRIVREPGRFALVMLAHPKCPCTRASVAELARLMARIGPRVGASVLVLHPEGMPAQWEHTDLWRSAEAIPGVAVIADADGAEAKRFGARTSGHVLLYDPAGMLQFTGGITASRGHEGDSFGEHRIVALVSGLSPDRRDSPVFGCSLFDETRTYDLWRE
jgi:hypothetical protein